MMLQTIILLALLFAALVLGMWLAFFGRRAFRLSGALFGFGVGVAGMLFAAFKMDIAFDSMIVLVGTPLLGLGLGLLGAFVPIAGSGLGGVCIGVFYGIGLVDAADILLNNSIDEFLYTAISIALISIIFILCLIWHESAKWMTTALVGSYTAALAVMLAFVFFTSGGFGTTEPALAGNFINKFNGLRGLMSSTTKLVMLGVAILIGAVGCVIQVKSKGNKEDYSLLDELDEQENDDLFPQEEEEPIRKRRGLFGRSKSIDEDEEEEEPDLFEEDLPKPKKERRRGRKPELLDEEEELEIPAAPPKRAPQSQVAAIDQTALEEKPTPVQETKEELGKTQVFKRIKGASVDKPASSQPKSPAQPAQAKPQAPQARPQEQQIKAPSMQQAPSEPKMPEAPSFTPRSQRRK